MEVKRRRSSNFWARGLLSATGVCVWWGAFHPVWWHPPTYDREQDFQLHVRKWKWILGKDSLESFIFVQNYLISIILRQDCLHESESGVDSSLFSVVLIVFQAWMVEESFTLGPDWVRDLQSPEIFRLFRHIHGIWNSGFSFGFCRLLQCTMAV